MSVELKKITIGKELLQRTFKEPISKAQKARVKLMLDMENRRIQIVPKDMKEEENLYFIKECSINKCVLNIPKVVRNFFPEANYIPAIMNDKLYILII